MFFFNYIKETSKIYLMKNNDIKEDIVNTSSGALNEPIKEDVEEVKKEASNKDKEKKEKKKKVIKYILYFAAILIITGLVLFFSLNSETKAFNEETNMIEEMKVYEAIPGTFGKIFASKNTIIFFFVFLGLILVYYGTKALNLMLYARLYTKKYKYHQALANQLIGVFYSDITPGASGGQFAQVYTFKKQGLPVSTAASILVMAFIVYQSVLVCCGLVSMVKINDVLRIQVIDISIGDTPIPIPVTVFIIVGFVLNSFIIILLFLMSYSRRLHSFILNHGINFLAKLHLIKHPEEKRESLRLQVENFRVELRRLQSNIPFTILVVFTTLFALFVNGSLPCICGYALNGFDGEPTFVSVMDNVFTSFCYMNFHQMMTGLVPLPGSAGISEFVFTRLFTYTTPTVIEGTTDVVWSQAFFTGKQFGAAGQSALMLLWRFGTFYIPFFISGIVSASYKSRGLKGKERFYKIDNSRKTFLTIQMETLDERKLTSSIAYSEVQYKRQELKNKIKKGKGKK